MRIPKQFNQFTNKNTLIIVAGKQGAVLYEARDGSINLRDSFILPHAHFFNDGPFYKARSQGGASRSGPVREVQDQKVVSDFIRELKKHMDNVRGNIYSDVCIMAPAKSKNAVVHSLPRSLKNKLTKIVSGNFMNKSPLHIIEKVQAQSKEAFVATDVEEQHILSNAEQASHFIRGKV